MVNVAFFYKLIEKLRTSEEVSAIFSFLKLLSQWRKLKFRIKNYLCLGFKFESVFKLSI